MRVAFVLVARMYVNDLHGARVSAAPVVGVLSGWKEVCPFHAQPLSYVYGYNSGMTLASLQRRDGTHVEFSPTRQNLDIACTKREAP